jgi:uncharacterized SAM-binding protein YcdF (DUF218 family)
LVSLILIAAVSTAVWLPALGKILIAAEEPQKADIIVVLAGDPYGQRILKGAELVKQGYALKALISGPNGMYGYHEDELAIPFAVNHGYPREYFIGAPNESHSTRDEADAILADLRRLGVRRFLLVTSDYHTRRAARIYREKARDFEFHTVAADDKEFQADHWWQSRQGRKVFFYEWTKTVTERIGL